MTEVHEKIRSALERNPSAMYLQIARHFEVPEVEVLRAVGAPKAVALDATRFEEIITALADFGTVHVIVSNGSVTMESQGVFGGFSTWGEFFNVQSGSLDMHIRWKRIVDVFALEKPSHMDGVSTLSIQFFDDSGSNAFKAFVSFGAAEAPPEQTQAFARLRDQFCK